VGRKEQHCHRKWKREKDHTRTPEDEREEKMRNKSRRLLSFTIL
jgi:hypothetical protein